MSNPTPPSSETHTLSTTRTHLQALSVSLQKLSDEITLTGPSTPLPSYAALVASLNFTNYHIQQLSAYISRNKAFLDAAHAYPLPTFPVQHEALLAQLVQKSEQQGVREGVERAVEGLSKWEKEEDAVMDDGSAVNMASSSSRAEELRALWTFAGQKAEEEIDKVPKGLDYTIVEAVNGIENVRTGIQRRLNAGPFADDGDEDDMSSFGSQVGTDDESEDDDEEGKDGDAMQVDKREEGSKPRAMAVEPLLPPMPLEDVLRFTITGQQQSRGSMMVRR